MSSSAFTPLNTYQPASASVDGVVTTTDQTFAGIKTFQGGCNFSTDTNGDDILSFIGSGTYTASATGFSGTAPSVTYTWSRIGKHVTVVIPLFSGTSNSTSMTLPLPSYLVPTSLATNQNNLYPRPLDNGTVATDIGLCWVVSGTSAIIFRKTPGGSTWTASGTKGIDQNIVLNWLVI